MRRSGRGTGSSMLERRASVVRGIQNGKRHWVASEALNCREERRRGRDQLVAFIWVQMEFFLNGRFESLPLSGIVWSAAERREERDAGSESAMRNQSACLPRL